MAAPHARTASLSRRVSHELQVRVALLCSALSLACGDKAPLPQRPPPAHGIGSSVAHTTTAPPERHMPDTARPVPSSFALADQLREPELRKPSPTGEAPAPKEEDKRDYAAELISLLGSPASCLRPRIQDGTLGPMTIQLAVQLMPSGELGRVEARCPLLSPAELQCVQRLVSPLRLRGPIEGAPLGVRAQVVLQPQAANNQPKPMAAMPDGPPEPRDLPPGDSPVKEIAVSTREVKIPPEPPQADETNGPERNAIANDTDTAQQP